MPVPCGFFSNLLKVINDIAVYVNGLDKDLVAIHCNLDEMLYNRSGHVKPGSCI